jgi:signal peptidase I
MSGILEFLRGIFLNLHATFGDGLFLLFGILAFIGIVAQWRLYEKANQPGIASIVPIWNFIVFLRIVGRPASHIFLFLIPVYGQLYMIPKVYIELCNSFGKTSILDYVMVILFNGFYILNLGLSYETEYLGPSYGRATVSKGQSALA